MEKILISDKLLKIVNKAAQTAKVESLYHENIMNEIEMMSIPETKKRALYECVIEYLHYGQFANFTLDDMIRYKHKSFNSMKCPYCKQQIMKFK